MNVLEKAEKALEQLKHVEGSTKSHVLQAAAGTLGRCLGALGNRPNCARHYANLLHSTIPTLLSLASHESAEVRLVGDEALNRAVVGGFAFHAHKTNIILQNQIDSTRNARWIRAALTRVCLGDSWLRPGVGKIRAQAQTLFPKLSQIVRHTSDIQLIVEALDMNLPRVLKALADYTTDEELVELSKALQQHLDSPEPAVRRGVASCLAHLCLHRDLLVIGIIDKAFDDLWPLSSDPNAVLGWIGVIKAILQLNNLSSLIENDVLTVQDYLQLYQLCVRYIESATLHNIQNSIQECLAALLARGTGLCRRHLTERRAIPTSLENRKRGASNAFDSASAITSVISHLVQHEEDMSVADEMCFSGGLRLGGLSHLSSSVSNLQTPDSPRSEMEMDFEPEQVEAGVDELVQETDVASDREYDEQVPTEPQLNESKINIGTLMDDDVPLKYCARLLVSRFLLTGNKGGLIADRQVRVSVKSSALNCLSEILHLYPQAMTVYLDKDADVKCRNISGSSEGTDSNQDQINDFILERNVCYQDSLTESLSQDLLNKSVDSQATSHSQQLSKKDSKSLEKSIDSVEQKSSSKDAPSALLDSKVYAKNDLLTSADSTNPNMTCSNFTTNSNMTESNDPNSTGYPMSSSGDVLSSSIDLDMKFDHFGESNTNLENLDALRELNREERPKRPLRRTDEVRSRDCPDGLMQKSVDTNKGEDLDGKDDGSKEFECQHMSEGFTLLASHSDPQIRGLVRLCIGSYLSAALDLSHGNCYRWRYFSVLPKDVSDNIGTDKLVEIVLKGLSDTVHSTVNHTLTALTKIATALATSSHYTLLSDILNGLVVVEKNGYWLCRLNLCKLYERLPYQRLYMLIPGYNNRSVLIMEALTRLLADQDQKVRHAAANTIAVIIPVIYPSRHQTPTQTLIKLSAEQSKLFTFETRTEALDLIRDMYFYHDLPRQFKMAEHIQDGGENLKMVVGDLMGKLMASSCKFYTQGLLEALNAISQAWPPWNHPDAYTDQGILEYCLDNLDCSNSSVAVKTLMLKLCTAVYPVEVHAVTRHRPSRDIFERSGDNTNSSSERFQHLPSPLRAYAAQYQAVVLRALNVLTHLLEELSPAPRAPGSPQRRSGADTTPRKTNVEEDKSTVRKKPQMVVGNPRVNFVGNFYMEPFYLKLYDNLRAAYSNHKINLDPKSSMFHDFLTTILDALAIQLELSTEKEFGYVTEEILYYLKTIMPLNAEKSVYCVTQFLKCLFGTNMINQYSDFMTVVPKAPLEKENLSFFEDVLLINKPQSLAEVAEDSRRSSISSNRSLKLSLDTKNPRMMEERQLLINLENFTKNKTDRKWSTNKKELERYIRLFEPVVIQALKSYTMQNDIPLQCQVLCLLNQLLTLRVNYCMLDSDQVFIGFLLKQLDLVEQHEIPNCTELVSDIMLFLVQLSSSKHHSKQIIEVPKLIQLCDGLLAAGAERPCLAALGRVAALAFAASGPSIGRVQQQEACAAREVLSAMIMKTAHKKEALDLISCVLALSQDQSESYYHWSQLASDTLLALLGKAAVELDSRGAVDSLERLLELIYRDVLLEQSRVETALRVLFSAPPDQATTPLKLKLRYLATIMVLLRKILALVPESEILLTINYLKSSYVSPQSIFFNVKTDIDPLNVQNVNENCANLSPDVVLVRFLFKTLTYVVMEMDNCHELDCANSDLKTDDSKDEDRKLMYSICVNIVCHVKHMLHLANGCTFPLTAKTAQTVLHNEQSGLNTGLYSPEENIPLELLNLICLRAARRFPLLTVHWSHLLIRLKFLDQKYWQTLVGFVRNLPLSSDKTGRELEMDTLQVGCFMAYCEYFIDNGLSDVVHLTWLLVNRVHALTRHCGEPASAALLQRVHDCCGASGLLLQAVAARCHAQLQDEFALNTHAVLSGCHPSQSGALVFLICRIIGKLEPAVAIRFAKLAIERCKLIKELPVDDILVQLSKEDVQVALELLQRDKIHVRYPKLILELNSLASSVFDLSPLELSHDRAVNPQYIVTAQVDGAWLLNLVKNRCCQTPCTALPKVAKQKELAQLLSNLSKDDLSTVLSCQEFDRKLLSACFKVSCDSYLRDFFNAISVYETREIEKDVLKQEREMIRMKEEMLSVVDSNKLNVVNTLQVFKKGDNKESKSQFFIPISENQDINEKFGNLQLTDEEIEIVPPKVPELYGESLAVFDKSLSDVIRLFPKQNRPLSQSENFNLNSEHTIDRYTKRCHQVFQDKLFYQEFLTVQTIMTGYLRALHRIFAFFDDIDCDVLDKCADDILPPSLAKNIAVFAVISLQYLSFLIKNKKIVESPVNNDVSFRTNVVTEKVVIENVISLTLDNVSKAVGFKEIWTELNADKNLNRNQSAISCLYAIVKYFVKNTKPLTLKRFIRPLDEGPQSDIILTCDKILTLVEYWEDHFYANGCQRSEIMGQGCRKAVEGLLVALARLDIVSSIALIPPIAWSAVDISSKKEDLQKVELPLQALQDMDALESFLFRVNFVGWSSKKQFEEIWVALLAALQGNGTHWAVHGITQLLLSTVPRVRRTGVEGVVSLHLPRTTLEVNNGMQRLRNLLVGTSAFSAQFENVNLERIPLMRDQSDVYHYAQFSTDFLKLAADIADDAPFRVKFQLKRMRKSRTIDVNSCLQLLMDVATQMLEPKAPTGLAARAALLDCIIRCSSLFTEPRQWYWLARRAIALAADGHATPSATPALLTVLSLCLAALPAQLDELSTVHQKLLKSLSSGSAPLRQAALQGCLLQLYGRARHLLAQQNTANPYQELVTQLNVTVTQYLGSKNKISLYEQSLNWTVLFTLIELGHPELMNTAVDFLIANPRHYCTDLVVKGITSMIRLQVLPKELKNTTIEKLLDNMNNYSEHHAIQILMVHLFSADNKLLSPKLTSDVSNMEPDVLMSSMERITLLYRVLRESRSEETKAVTMATVKYSLRETLPPVAALSRVVIEFLESCKLAENQHSTQSVIASAAAQAEILFEVFEVSVAQDQLAVLSGWIFDALCHLLSGKITSAFLPYCTLLLLISASGNEHIRKLAPLCYCVLKQGFHNCRKEEPGGVFAGFLGTFDSKMSFSDRRLLCTVALHSNFTGPQLERLKELCEGNECLDDLAKCLNA